MKYVFVFLFGIIFTTSYSQMAGLGFFDLKYGTVGEDFIDATSEGFSFPEVQLKESGIGFGGSGLFLFNKFSVGGGGGVVFIKSDFDDIKMNIGSGYGTFGYNFVYEEDLLVNVGARLGGFGNTLSVTRGDDIIPYQFGDYLISTDAEFTSGSFLYGAEVNVIKLFPRVVPGLAVGLTAYFMSPISNLTWYDSNDAEVNNIEDGEYIHFGIGLKIGGGAIF